MQRGRRRRSRPGLTGLGTGLQRGLRTPLSA